MTRTPKLGNTSGLAAKCPTCGKVNRPYEVNVSGFDDAFCRYQCEGGMATCEECATPENDPSGCPECEGTGKRPCSEHYAGDGPTTTWVE